MPATQRRSTFMPIFGLVGLAWFLVHAVEYVYARYDVLQAAAPLPAPLGLAALFNAIPQWADIALTAAIWLGLLGAFLLLLRDKASVLILSLTLLATLPVMVWAVLEFLRGIAASGDTNLVLFAAGQVIFAFGLWLYARTARRFGSF